jgi:hypothetical protein
MLQEIEKYIDFHILFTTMSIIIAYQYITKGEDQVILQYKK